ncbi:hypothetical protein KGF56_002602 [Candida oxycetoniae]|uniref:Transcription initiation factor TFIID subunit 13 n=1 Tax=Candida oxycetoniae TaxID=497107 RepID=A0AAI9WXS1_9ASCO|nr:uncharacterized protein KGF56_002602 [Candida oxycetoniae]KAI3404607.1 hypothetical protein KGF56_002602 [Candida oxycetoniae]
MSNKPNSYDTVNQNLPPIQYPKRKRKGLFTKDIENILYAMGDTPFSHESTVNAVEDILIEYIATLATQMVDRAVSQGRRNRIKLNDLAFVLRNDPLKLSRMLYILEQSHKIEKAKKMFDDEAQDGTGKKKRDDEYSDGESDEDMHGDGIEKEEPEQPLGEVVLDAEGNFVRHKRKYKKRAVELDENGNPIKKKYKKRKPKEEK